MEGSKWTAVLFVNNVTNKMALLTNSPAINVNVRTFNRTAMEQPLTVGIDLSLKWAASPERVSSAARPTEPRGPPAQARRNPARYNGLEEPSGPGAAVGNAKSLIRDALPGEPGPGGVLRKLASEVAAGEVRLPSLPGIAVRVQQVLEDPRAARTRVAQVIGADAALAARILRLANSSFFNPSDAAITDLRHALTRLGNQMIR